MYVFRIYIRVDYSVGRQFFLPPKTEGLWLNAKENSFDSI